MKERKKIFKYNTTDGRVRQGVSGREARRFLILLSVSASCEDIDGHINRRYVRIR